jgi:hypothetical protein
MAQFPSTSSASDIWSLTDQREGRMGSNWPIMAITVEYLVIAGAGGAAHLPGMIAAQTHLPVFGVPVQSKALSGMDSLLSIVQMPAGIPTANS